VLEYKSLLAAVPTLGHMTGREGRALRRRSGAAAVAALGLALAAGFAWNFLRELAELSAVSPPVAVFLFGLALSGALVYAGARWFRARYTGAEARRVAGWCYAGAAAFALVVGFTAAVRLAEGRSLAEPALELLVAVGGGAFAGLLAGHQNVLARRQVDEAERARQSMAFLNRTLRHEVLNGIQLVSGHTHSLRGRLGDDAAVAIIEDTSRELTELLDDVGRVADVHAGSATLEPVDLVGVLAEEADRFRDAHPGATVETDLPDRAPVRANDAVDHVFRNLLDNAAEHGSTSPPSHAREDADEHAGDAPTVELTADVGPEVVTVAVADDGPGIPDEEKADLFDPTEGGTHGFGLHLVSTLVEGYGGEVTVGDSELGGAVFVVDLPRPETPAGGVFDGGAAIDARKAPTEEPPSLHQSI